MRAFNTFTDGVLLHTFSLGTSRKMWRGSTNFAYQYTVGGPRAVGTSSIVGGDFSNSHLIVTGGDLTTLKIHGVMFTDGFTTSSISVAGNLASATLGGCVSGPITMPRGW